MSCDDDRKVRPGTIVRLGCAAIARAKGQTDFTLSNRAVLLVLSHTQGVTTLALHGGALMRFEYGQHRRGGLNLLDEDSVLQLTGRR